MIKDFLSLRNLVTMIIISATVMFILAFYSLIIYDDLSFAAIVQVVFGIVLSYYSLFANEAISTGKRIARSSYLALAITATSGFIFFMYLFSDSVLFFESTLDIRDSLSIRAHGEVVFLVIGALSLLFAAGISTRFVLKNGEEE